MSNWVTSAIKAELERQNLTPFSAARAAGLPENAFRTVLQGRSPTARRLEEICKALGLEFYVGPPRRPETWKNEPESSRSSGSGGEATAGKTRKNELDFSTSAAPPWLQEALDLPPGAEVDTVIQAVNALRESGPDSLQADLRDLSRLVEELSVVKSETQSLHSVVTRLKPLADLIEDPEALASLKPGFGKDQESRHAEVPEYELAMVDRVDFDVAAGGGSDPSQAKIIGTLAFCRDWLRSHHLNPLDCVVAGVRGESMEETLCPGSSILVDRTRTAWRPGKIFVVRTPDGVVVKYAGEDKSGNWWLVSEHPSYGPVLFPDEAKIIGQVVWTARTLLDHSYIPKALPEIVT